MDELKQKYYINYKKRCDYTEIFVQEVKNITGINDITLSPKTTERLLLLTKDSKANESPQQNEDKEEANRSTASS